MRILSSLIICMLALSSWAGRVVTDSIQSTTLNSCVKYNVYLPDGFSRSEKQYPVVYLLHGLYGTYKDWSEQGDMQAIADELIRSGEAQPMVIIMPNAGGDLRTTWNGYFNMPGWSYESFFFDELLPTAEQKYRCIGDKQHRAIMGLSMGGGGSTVYCQRHPDLFAACYSMSGWLDNGEAKEGENGKDYMYYVMQSVHDHSAVGFMENITEEAKKDVRSIAWFFDCGDDDFLMDLSYKMYNLLKQAKAKAELRIRNGSHNWEYWRGALRTALPFASRNFSLKE